MEGNPVPVTISFISIANLLSSIFFPDDPAIAQKQRLLSAALEAYFAKNGVKDRTVNNQPSDFFKRVDRYLVIDPVMVRTEASALNKFNFASMNLVLRNNDGTSMRTIPLKEANYSNKQMYMFNFPIGIKVSGTDDYIYTGSVTVEGSINERADPSKVLMPSKGSSEASVNLADFTAMGQKTGKMLYGGAEYPITVEFKVRRVTRQEFDLINKIVKPPSNPNAVPLQRLFNGNKIDHYYTTNPAEMQSARATGYTGDDFVECYVLRSPQPGALCLPLYRLMYQYLKNDHYFTGDDAEIKRLTTRRVPRTPADAIISAFDVWTNEGLACYVYLTQQPGTVPLYQLYRNSSADHFYTTNPDEVDRVIANSGFVFEKIIGYVYPAYNYKNK
jgi:hypothetical protein